MITNATANPCREVWRDTRVAMLGCFGVDTVERVYAELSDLVYMGSPV